MKTSKIAKSDAWAFLITLILLMVFALFSILQAKADTTVEPGWPGRLGTSVPVIASGSILCWKPDSTNSYGNCVVPQPSVDATGKPQVPWRWATANEIHLAFLNNKVVTVNKPIGF